MSMAMTSAVALSPKRMQATTLPSGDQAGLSYLPGLSVRSRGDESPTGLSQIRGGCAALSSQTKATFLLSGERAGSYSLPPRRLSGETLSTPLALFRSVWQWNTQPAAAAEAKTPAAISARGK